MPSPTPHFIDRYDAGRRLGRALRDHANDRPLIVLGLLGGGMPVATRVAEALEAPLDAFVVRTLRVPGHPELAMGAIASGGTEVLNRDVIESAHLSQDVVDEVIAKERRQLERQEWVLDGGRRLPVLVGETVIVVDDGADTGTTMRLAVNTLRQLGPRAVIAAMPVASRAAIALLDATADECVALIAPDPFHRVGAWYEDFSETTDAEVRVLLAEAQRRYARILDTSLTAAMWRSTDDQIPSTAMTRSWTGHPDSSARQL